MPLLLIFENAARNVIAMKKRLILISCAVALLLAAPAHAACFADYIAKKENPLKLHYGVMQVDISPCRMSDNVKALVTKRLKAGGWSLLKVRSVFDDGGLGKRKQDAGQYFLRF